MMICFPSEQYHSGTVLSYQFNSFARTRQTVRVSGGDLCEAEAPTEPAGETVVRRATRCSFFLNSGTAMPRCRMGKSFARTIKKRGNRSQIHCKPRGGFCQRHSSDSGPAAENCRILSPPFAPCSTGGQRTAHARGPCVSRKKRVLLGRGGSEDPFAFEIVGPPHQAEQQRQYFKQHWLSLRSIL